MRFSDLLFFLVPVVRLEASSSIPPRVLCSSTDPPVVHVTEFTPIASPDFPRDMFDRRASCSIIVDPGVDALGNPRTTTFFFTNGFVRNGTLTPCQLGRTLDWFNVDTRNGPTWFSCVGRVQLEVKVKLGDPWQAFEGFVTPYTECTLSPLQLPVTDVHTQVAIRYACGASAVQTFTTLPSFGFKIILHKLVLENLQVFEIYNQTNHLIFKIGEKCSLANQIMYTDNSVITIRLRVLNYALDFPQVVGTVVPIDLPTESFSSQCSVTQHSESLTEWSLMDPVYGYPNNVQCDLTFHLNPNQAIFFKFEVLQLEAVADYFEVSVDGFSWVRFDSVVNTVNELVQVVPVKHVPVQFRFRSDQSINQVGFKLKLHKVDCVCMATEVLFPCNETATFGVLKHWGHNYCLNMFCSFSLVANPACPQMCSFVTIPLTVAGSYQLYFDGELVLHDGGSALIPPRGNTTLIFSSNNHSVPIAQNDVGTMFVLSSYSAPSNVFIELTSAKPFAIFSLNNLSSNTWITIIQDKDLMSDVVEIYCDGSYNYLDYYTMHNGNYRFVASVQSMMQFYENSILTIRVSDEVFALYYLKPRFPYEDREDQEFKGYLYIRALRAQSANCLFSNWMFQLGKRRGKRYQSLSVVATTSGSCSAVLLLNEETFAYFDKFWTNAKTASVELRNLLDDDFVIANFRKSTVVGREHMIGFFGVAYELRVPANSSVFVDFNAQSTRTLYSQSQVISFGSCYRQEYKLWGKNNGTVSIRVLRLHNTAMTLSTPMKNRTLTSAGELITFKNSPVINVFLDTQTACAATVILVEVDMGSTFSPLNLVTHPSLIASQLPKLPTTTLNASSSLPGRTLFVLLLAFGCHFRLWHQMSTALSFLRFDFHSFGCLCVARSCVT